jgi:hypothetical protein
VALVSTPVVRHQRINYGRRRSGLKDAWRAVLDLLDETIEAHPLPAEGAAAIIGTEGPAGRFSHGLIEDPVTDFVRGRPAAAR